MLIEHSFVTTLEATETIRRASEFLTSKGYEVLPQQAFAMGAAAGQVSTLSLRRGQAKAVKAKRIDDLPQQLRLEWDRGRVMVAASVEPYERSTFSGGTDLPPDSPKLEPHRQLLTSIVVGLEALLAHQQSPQEVEAVWRGADAAVEAHRDRKARQARNKWIIVGLFMLVLVALAVFSATR